MDVDLVLLLHGLLAAEQTAYIGQRAADTSRRGRCLFGGRHLARVMDRRILPRFGRS